MRSFSIGAACGVALLALSGCGAQPAPPAPPMTRTQAEQTLQFYASDPHAPTVARDAAQQETAEDQAQQMLSQGH